MIKVCINAATNIQSVTHFTSRFKVRCFTWKIEERKTAEYHSLAAWYLSSISLKLCNILLFVLLFRRVPLSHLVDIESESDSTRAPHFHPVHAVMWKLLKFLERLNKPATRAIETSLILKSAANCKFFSRILVFDCAKQKHSQLTRINCKRFRFYYLSTGNLERFKFQWKILRFFFIIT